MMIKIEQPKFLLEPGLDSGRMLLDLWSENRRSCRLSNKKSPDFTTSSVVIQPHNDQSHIDDTHAMTVKLQVRAFASQP